MHAEKVETAKLADVEEIMALCRMLHEENGMMSYDDNKVRHLVERGIAKDGAIIGIVRDSGKIVGCVAVFIDTIWYSNDLIISELFNFVHPEYRKSNYAKMLIGFAKECSDRLNLPLFIGVLTNDRMEAKVRLYKRQLQVAGAFFIHNVKAAE